MSDPAYVPPERVAAELQKLHQLFQSGAITDAEYTQAKAKVLSAEPVTVPVAPVTPTPSELTVEAQIKLLNLEMQNALLKAEQDWQYIRESHLIHRPGNPHEPSKADLVWVGLVSAVIIVPTLPLFAFVYQSPGVLVFIAIFLVFPIGWFMYTKSRLTDFENALDYYHRRRSDIRNRYEQRIKELQSRQYD